VTTLKVLLFIELKLKIDAFTKNYLRLPIAYIYLLNIFPWCDEMKNLFLLFEKESMEKSCKS